MRDWKFSLETKGKQNFITDSEKGMGNFLKTGTMMPFV